MSRKRANNGISISLFSFQDIITCLSGIMILLVLMLCVDIVSQKILNAQGDASHPPPAAIPSPDEEATINSGSETSEGEKFTDPVKVAKEKIESEYRKRKMISDIDILEGQIKKLHGEVTQIEQDLLSKHTREQELGSQLIDLRKTWKVLSMDKSISFIPEKGSNLSAILVECSRDSIRAGRYSDNKPPQIFSTNKNGVGKFIRSLKKFNKHHYFVLFVIKPSGIDYTMNLIHKVQLMGFDVGYDAMVEEQYISFEGAK